MQETSQTTLNVTTINPGEDQRWDDFACSQPDTTIYHCSCWAEVLRSTYGHELIYLALTNDREEILGIAPFILVNSRLTGKRIVSLPFASYCNPILPAGGLEKVFSYLHARYPDVDYIELKVIENKTINIPDGFSKHSQHVTHILGLEKPLDELFRSFHSTSVRQRIRKGEKNNLTLRMGETEEDLRHFYRLHTVVRKKHGLPPQPFDFFSLMWSALKSSGQAFVPLIEFQDRVISAAFILKFKDTYHFEYSATDTEHFQSCANQILIWESIKLAHSAGARFFDFGRSALNNRSLIEFKKRWNAKEIALSSYFYPKRPALDCEVSTWRQVLNHVNRHLPESVLQLEGRLLYPHLG